MGSTADLVEAARKIIAAEEAVARSMETFTNERSSPTERVSLRGPSKGTHPSPRSGTYASHKKSRKAYLFFSATFAMWMVSLLAVYLPVSGLTTPTYPFIISDSVMILFLAATALAFITSFTLGLRRLREKE